ncbi:glutamate synthase alpha subunit domain protein [Methanosalsum zhilinae DSM 4017]|uniref:Glutamate synthase alpha subunit domain protein n=1 Tax=Methanosalsum zhilinae (strain DSM 4017 / NBRC 107636 / OCM 62 / WeN5) TaxID=679901 RepID=F7XL76_METZD|nr:hypothetical protein [Methanosalsum zhilinae]AEH60212.1 glutamate synthase alpha subunit domain protein [Methanosalsum zhilinae DSM 4017]
MIPDEKVVIDARGIHYTRLNGLIRQAVEDGATEIVLKNVLGQRFIADALKADVCIEIYGVPGGDLGMFMSGPVCIVHGNCEHAPGNTMDDGRIIVHGSTGDAAAHSMRGGKIFVRDYIGYRGGIHMKEYDQKKPTLVIGKSAHAFLGEYMAGGLIIMLGIDQKGPFLERGIGSGIHGGRIVIRGPVDDRYLGVGARKMELDENMLCEIHSLVKEFCNYFNIDDKPLMDNDYTIIGPSSSRPFAGKYTWE